MVTSSAVVGSSAMMQLGVAGQRHGDHHALAHAAGQLVRVLLQPPLRLGDADQAEQLDGPLVVLRRAACRDAPPASRSAGARWSAPGSATSSAPGRSCRCRGRAHGASRPSAACSRSRPPNIDRALDDLAGRIRDQPQDRHRANGLAAARLADDGDGLALGHVIGDAVHRLNDARGREEVGSEIPDLDDVRQPPRQRRIKPAPPWFVFLQPVCFADRSGSPPDGKLCCLFGRDFGATQVLSRAYSRVARDAAGGSFPHAALGLSVVRDRAREETQCR